MARRAAVTLLIALVASLLPAALWAQEAAEGAYIPEWGVSQNLALALLGGDPDLQAVLNYQDADPAKSPLTLDITVMTCDGPLIKSSPPPPEDIVDFGDGRRRLAQEAAAPAPPCSEPNRRRKAAALATYLPRGLLSFANVTEGGKKLQVRVSYNGALVPSQATTNHTKTCERLDATFRRNSLYSKTVYLPNRDCNTEICCFLVFKPTIVQYQTANTGLPDAHSSLSAAEAATVLLDVKKPFAATSDRCDGVLGLFGCPRVVDVVGTVA